MAYGSEVKGDWARRLKELRKDLGMTETAVAFYLDMKERAYIRYEDGQNRMPAIMVLDLARVFKTDSGELLEYLGGQGPMPVRAAAAAGRESGGVETARRLRGEPVGYDGHDNVKAARPSAQTPDRALPPT